MYLDVLGMVELEIRGEGERLRNYLRHEYSDFEAEEPHDSEPDVIVTLKPDASSEDASVHVRGPVSYDDDGVFLQHRLPDEEPEYNAFRIDFDTVGGSPCRASCDPGFNPHFFGIIVDYLIHFHLIERGAVFCHSCAFEHEGNVVLCPAWRNVGKTNLLLSFLRHGVTYIADDWCVLTREGEVYALPKRLNLLYYNFKEYPRVLERTPDDVQAIVDFVNRSKAGEIDLNRDAIDTLTQQARMRLPPVDLFDDVQEGEPVPVDFVFYLRRTSRATGGIELGELSRDAFPYRTQAILEFEQSYFHVAYQVHKAQTGRVNAYLESAKKRTIDILDGAARATPELYELSTPSQQASSELKRQIRETLADGG